MSISSPLYARFAKIRRSSAVGVRIRWTIQRLRMGSWSFPGSRHSRTNCTSDECVSKMRRKKACASGVKSSAPSSHRITASRRRPQMWSFWRPSLSVRSLRHEQVRSCFRCCFAYSWIQGLLPDPGGPVTMMGLVWFIKWSLGILVGQDLGRLVAM